MRSATRVFLALAVAALPVSALAQDAGTSPPGRATEVAPCDEPGPPLDGAPDQPCPGVGHDAHGVEIRRSPGLPYRGTLVDRERMGAIYAKRIAAEMERDAQRLLAQDAAARQRAAEAERDAAQGRPSWGVLVGVTGAALVLGLVGGVAAALAIQDRAR